MIAADIIEFQLMMMGIPREDILKMDSQEVLRKWVVGMELLDRQAMDLDGKFEPKRKLR